MIVVADTTPLNYLIMMGEEQVLGALYGRVILPLGVVMEMRAEGAPAEVQRWAHAQPEWVEIIRIEAIDSTLSARLGAGEREAISLAQEIHADVLLMDDQPARAAAEMRGLLVSGTLSVLLRASRLGLIDFERAMTEIKRLGFRMSAEVEAKMRLLSKRS